MSKVYVNSNNQITLAVGNTDRFPRPLSRGESLITGVTLPTNWIRGISTVNSSSKAVTTPGDTTDPLIDIFDAWYDQQISWRDHLSRFGREIKDKGDVFLDLAYGASKLVYEGLPNYVSNIGTINPPNVLVHTAPSDVDFIQRIRIDPGEDELDIFVKEDIDSLAEIQINNNKYTPINSGNFSANETINSVETYKYTIDFSDFSDISDEVLWVRFKKTDGTYYDHIRGNITLKSKIIQNASAGALDIHSVEAFAENIDLFDPSAFPFYDSGTNSFSRVILWVEKVSGNRTNLADAQIYGNNDGTKFYDIFWK